MTGTDGLACAAFLDQAGWVLLLCFLIGGIWTVGVPLRSWWHDRAAMRASGHKPEETGAAGRHSLREAHHRIAAELFDGPLAKPPVWVVVVTGLSLVLRIALALAKTGCTG
ncbi:MAG: hypothetical protein CML50_22645 [Rhodobacteraceae bacterium]|jgi:hypothetical protein|uniref:Uncharacterized protein n=1 Tax=Salipiger profundus TaxID=1229727 RepID=A0A1U7CZS6_9RHOB|nr:MULTISPECIES: hypothetical protein [Salipiger]APX21382.1 hypothetical protein Ga0080559_TMP586 [Salipiger profundus]MAB08792.1 hypothetical protein [Paracoccaceae bacterium]GGA02767.1 hypothetical protein GCM10011326_12690 [Salipiger profundus]SFC23230.1 hypothetical protein SAMN05444415_102426 [Salipiger profundus]